MTTAAPASSVHAQTRTRPLRGGFRLDRIAAIVVALGVSPRAAPADEALLPRARQVVVRERDAAPLARDVTIESDRSLEDAYAISVLRELSERPSATTARPRRPRVDRIFLKAGPPREVLPGAVAGQSYTIEITPDRVVITGMTAAARLYGAQTLRQLARSNRDLPTATIRDGPALAVRGLSLDISRGRMPNPENFLHLLDLCASLKLNHLLLYIEDTYAYTRVPAAALRRYGLTREALRTLAHEAAHRSITLVPVVQTLAHQEHLLSHPVMWKHAEAPGWAGPWSRSLLSLHAGIQQLFPRLGRHLGSGVASSQFAVTERETQALVHSMLDDVLEASGATDVHIGCDEPAELGRGASRARAQRDGIERIYVDHVRRMAHRAREKWNARTWIYDDFILEHRAILDSLPADVVLVDWRKYDPAADYSDLEKLPPRVRSRTITSPGLWNWSAVIPAYQRAVANITRSTEVAKRTGCLGSVLASWGDGGAEDLLGNDILGIAYFAECSWAPEAPARTDFARAYSRIRFQGPSASAEAAIEALLDLEIPQVVYSHRLVYRPIQLRRRTAPWRAGLDELDRTVSVVDRALPRLRPAATYAAAELQALRVSVDRLEAAIHRERTLDSLAVALESRTTRPAGLDQADVLARLAKNERRVQAAYQEAWLEHNEVSELETVRRRFREQLHQLDSLRACAESAGLRSHPRRASAPASVRPATAP